MRVSVARRWSPGFSHVLGTLHTLEASRTFSPARNSILTATLGPQSWRNAKRGCAACSRRALFQRGLRGATFVVILTASGFSWRNEAGGPRTGHHLSQRPTARLIWSMLAARNLSATSASFYEIQSACGRTTTFLQLPASTVPQSARGGQPGERIRQVPRRQAAEPRDEIGRNLQVLAAECPMLTACLARGEFMRCAVHSDVDRWATAAIVAGYVLHMCAARRDVLYCEDASRRW